MNDCLEKEVQNRFSTLPSDQRYFIYNLGKKPEKCCPLTRTVDQQSTQVVHRLVLVTTTTSTTELYEQGDNEQLISGLEVYEYSMRSTNDTPKRIIYISKIDTTGSTLAKGVTRRLVQAYVASQQQLGGECSIHVFARAQPQYLFPRSADDPSKHVLTDRQLVAWWRTTLAPKDLYYSMDNSNNVKVTPFWIIPGVDEQGALYDIGQKQHLLGDNTITWRYGYPYAGDALAKHVIPRFEDDGKARYLGTLLSATESEDEQQNLTVDEFWTLFGYSEECGSGKVAAIFVVEISSPTTTTTTTHGNTATEKMPLVNEDDYTWVWNALMSQNFCNESFNLKSTKLWLGTWLDILTPRSFAVTTNQNNDNNNNNCNIAGSGSITTPPLIQTLAVKRKPKSSSSSTSCDSLNTSETDPQTTSASSATTETVNLLVPKRRKKEN